MQREDSLTKNELVAFVDRVYASWNQVVPQSSAKVIYEAWWRLLSDLPLEGCHQVVDSLAISDSYMPRPGVVRRALLSLNTTNPSPSAGEAWATLQQVAAAAARGEYIQVSLHECVSEAVALLGGTAALALHTNGDRNSFTEVYNQVVSSWENELAKLPSNETTRSKLPEEK